jgi:hypothetical protein
MVDVDVGMNRCGILWERTQDIVALCKLASEFGEVWCR